MTAHVVRADSRHLPLPAPTDADIGWLAGLIDSESTISLTRSQLKNPILRLSIYNSDERILDKAATIITALGIDYSERADTRAVRTGYVLNVSTAGCIAMYERVRPHLVKHANRYDAAYWFIAPRLEGRQRVFWTDRDREMWEQLRQVLNAR